MIIHPVALNCLEEAIREIQAQLQGDLVEEVKGGYNMHLIFATAFEKHLPHGFNLTGGQKGDKNVLYDFAVAGSKRRKRPDFILQQPDGSQVYFELSLSDSEPKCSFAANMRKQKVTKDIAILTHPRIEDHGCILLFAIRWDKDQRRSQPALKECEKRCRSDCERDPNIQETSGNFKEMQIAERGFFFGKDFCFDFSLYYAGQLVSDLKSYREIAPTKHS